MLLDHPFLIGETYEEVQMIAFPERDLAELRRAIFEVEQGVSGLDADALRLQLGSSGFAITVDAVRLVLADHASTLSRVNDAEGVRRYWEHVMRMLRESEWSEREGLSDEVADDPSGEAWQRSNGWEPREDFSEDEFPPSRAEGASPR
jgi:hypothetical protein